MNTNKRDGRPHRTHKMSSTLFYKKWCNLVSIGRVKGRDKRSGTRYTYITGVSRKWSRFDAFKEDMYESYLEYVSIHGEKHISLKRKNPGNMYSKENCYWGARVFKGSQCEKLQSGKIALSKHARWALDIIRYSIS